MQDNIFVTGGRVPKSRLIGYERYLKELRNHLFENHNNISIVGLRRMGKSSLINAVMGEADEILQEAPLSIIVDLGLLNSFDELLEVIAEEVFDYIDSNDLSKDLQIDRYCKKLKKTQTCKIQYRMNLLMLLQRINEYEKRCYLVIDEFDAASNLFQTSADFEFLRELSSRSRVQLVTVSRRRVYMIEYKTGCSTLDGIMMTFIVRGFDENDVKKYYDLLENKYRVGLSDEDKYKIGYFSGFFPYIYSLFGFTLVNSISNEENDTYVLDINNIFKKIEIDVQNHYSLVYDLMKDEIIPGDISNDKSRVVEKLMSVLLGPIINLTSGQIDYLLSLGYLYKKGDDYYSLSEYYSDYLKNQEYHVDGWNLIIEMEKKLKLMVRRQAQRKLMSEEIPYEYWQDLFESIGEGTTLGTYDAFIESSWNAFHREQDLLDVAGIGVVIKIIKFGWETYYTKFFNNDAWECWKGKLNLCVRARNPYAHGNTHLLTIEEVRIVNEYCKEILNTIGKTNACDGIEIMNVREDAKRRRKARDEYYQISVDSVVSEQMKGTTIIFVAALQNRNSIKGYYIYQNKPYRATIKEDEWRTHYPLDTMGTHLGNKYPAIIFEVNRKQNSVVLRLKEQS